jgi:hypothetical protein
MKLIPLILFLLIASSCQQAEVDENDIEVSQGKVYLKSSGKPFSGIVNYRFDNPHDSNKISSRFK